MSGQSKYTPKHNSKKISNIREKNSNNTIIVAIAPIQYLLMHSIRKYIYIYMSTPTSRKCINRKTKIGKKKLHCVINVFSAQNL